MMTKLARVIHFEDIMSSFATCNMSLHDMTFYSISPPERGARWQKLLSSNWGKRVQEK